MYRVRAAIYISWSTKDQGMFILNVLSMEVKVYDRQSIVSLFLTKEVTSSNKDVTILDAIIYRYNIQVHVYRYMYTGTCIQV